MGEGESEDGVKSPQPGGGSPQDLVDAVDRLEAEEDEVDRELNGSLLPNGSRDLDEVRQGVCNCPLQAQWCLSSAHTLKANWKRTEALKYGSDNNWPAVPMKLSCHHLT